MNKFIFSLIAAAAMAIPSLQAQTQWLPLTSPAGSPVDIVSTGEVPPLEDEFPSRASGSIFYGDAGTMANAIKYSSKPFTVAAAVCMSVEDRAIYAGNKVTHIRFSHYELADPSVEEITVFVTDDLYGERIFEQTAKLNSKGRGTQSVALTTPFEITEGEYPLYFGWQITCQECEGTYPLALDFKSCENGNSNYNGELKGDEWVWARLPPLYGNFCVWARVTGDDMPENEITLNSVSAPTSVEPGKQFNTSLSITNNACNAIKNITVHYTVGDSEPVDKTLTIPALAYNNTASVNIPMVCETIGNNIPIVCEVTALNGEPDRKPEDNKGQAGTMCLPAGSGFERNVLVEEGTGTWCGYCPRGIVAFEQMRSKYGDNGRYVLVAAHQGDVMAIDEYQGFIRNYFTGFPSGTVDRTLSIGMSPASVESAYQQELNRPAFAKVGLEVGYDEAKKQMCFTSTVQFAQPDKGANYKIAYLITEDKVGPYSQTNYYSGGAAGAMGGFESKSNPVSLKFNEVAVVGTEMMGISANYPEDVVPGTDYVHTGRLSTKAVKNLANCRFVAILLNAGNGAVENVAESTTYSGVDIVETDADNAPAEYFNLQGVRVSGDVMSAGIYLRRQNNAVTKIVVR